MNMKYAILLPFLTALPLYAGVNGDVRQGGKLYAHEQYGQALSKYQSALQEDPNNPQANFGAGAAAYYLKDYDTAAKAFENTVDNSPELRQDALFNLGNTHYRAHQKQEAIAAYKQAILQNPQDKEAIHNLQLLLKEQQSKQNKNNQNNDNKDKNSQNQDSQDQQNNQGQAPQQQDPQQNKQPQDPKPQQQGMNQQDAQRVMQLARDNEYRRPTQPGPAGNDESVEKDW
ncbi:MAG: tetratricopeptide repeat protein [Elusimicrobiaceae bacterium]|nr:tetratricopeptide repeat protein [Elusimicrobiaceae bacterium]